MSKENQDMSISKIFVAVDGSRLSLDAAKKAIHIAELYGAHLIACMLFLRTSGMNIIKVI